MLGSLIASRVLWSGDKSQTVFEEAFRYQRISKSQGKGEVILAVIEYWKIIKNDWEFNTTNYLNWNLMHNCSVGAYLVSKNIKPLII